MFRRYIFIFCVFILMPVISSADTIYLKDGTVLDGRVIEKTHVSTKVMVDGHPKVFYAGQIDRIVEDAKMGEEVNVDYGELEGISKNKVNLIVRLLKANGLTSTLQKSIEDAIKSAPPERREEFKALFNFDELVKILIPIFDLYYSEDELKELIKMYENPVRKKEIENTPAIIKEALEKMIKHIYDKVQK